MRCEIRQMVYLLEAIARVCNRYMRSGWNGQRGTALAGHHFSQIAIEVNAERLLQYLMHGDADNVDTR